MKVTMENEKFTRESSILNWQIRRLDGEKVRRLQTGFEIIDIIAPAAQSNKNT